MHTARSSAARAFRDAAPSIPPHAAPLVLREYSDTDAAGDARLVAEGVTATDGPALRVLSVFDTSATLRRRIWENRPHCVECGARIDSPDSAGYLTVPDEGIALACRGLCFPRAVARFNPTLDTAAALERDREVAALVPDLRLVPDAIEGEG